MDRFERLLGAKFVSGLPLTFFNDALLWKCADDKWFKDWVDPWSLYGEPLAYGTAERGRTRRKFYEYNLEGRKECEQKAKARLVKGRTRRGDIYADCAGLPTWPWCGGEERWTTMGASQPNLN